MYIFNTSSCQILIIGIFYILYWLVSVLFCDKKEWMLASDWTMNSAFNKLYLMQWKHISHLLGQFSVQLTLPIEHQGLKNTIWWNSNEVYSVNYSFKNHYNAKKHTLPNSHNGGGQNRSWKSRCFSIGNVLKNIFFSGKYIKIHRKHHNI